MIKRNTKIRKAVRGTNVIQNNLPLNENEWKYALENHIINISDVRDMIIMKKREEILKNHPYSVWQGRNNGLWYTYLPDSTKSRGKALKKLTSREKLEDAIVAYWTQREKDDIEKQKKQNVYTFMDIYNLWRNVKDQTVSENTVAKYNSDRKRFFDGKDLSKMDIREIDSYAVDIFMHQNIEEHRLQREAMSKLFGYVSNTMSYAAEKKYIDMDPILSIKSKKYNKQCRTKQKLLSESVIMPEDMKELQERFRKDHEEKRNYIPTYAVELASLTGMRAGELAALRWDNIKEDYILIAESEKTNPKKTEFYIDQTKNKKSRIFPMTEQIRTLLNKIKNVEIEYGYFCEWVFADDKGRVHGPRISSCAKTKSRQLGLNMKGKGIHGYRKTINSNMRSMGVAVPTAAAMLGHSEEVNKRYYTYDIADIQDKAKIISAVNQKTKCG